MGRLLPASFGRDAPAEPDPRVIGIEGDDADELLAAMSSTTARQLLAELHEEPAAPSELAERSGTSLQNAQYHLKKLAAAGAVEVADTVYSEKGREMKVYAPADRPLVVVAGGAGETASLRTALATLLSGVAVVGLLAVLVQFLLAGPTTDAGGGQPVAMSTERAATPTAAAGGGSVVDPAALLAPLAEPGAVFFLGGLAAALVLFGVWAVRR